MGTLRGGTLGLFLLEGQRFGLRWYLAGRGMS
ncbi:hypothetical protein N007_15895 [Alicyclobacillus acidoterrestris ATCC 49025]|nr:hypothetical protein N007_15895 [Alicyclobacillus acidoterrestris ATCC 49025]